MEYTTSLKAGFIKRAAEAGICEAAALALFKEAGIADYFSNQFTNFKDTMTGAGKAIMNNPIVHGARALNPLSGSVNGVDDYFSNIGSRYNKSMDLSNVDRAGHYANVYQNRLNQGDVTGAQEYGNLAAERAKWTQGAGTKNQIFDTMSNATNAYNTQAQDAYAKQQEAQRASEDAYNRFQQPPQIWQAPPKSPSPAFQPNQPAQFNGFNAGPMQHPAPKLQAPAAPTPQLSPPQASAGLGSPNPNPFGATATARGGVGPSTSRKPYFGSAPNQM